MNLIDELRWRGMIQDMMPGTEEQLLKEMTTAYIGFDPTADSLHIGSLVPILLLVHLQKAGHKPIALVGGATGMVGDPSGKSEERNLLSEEVLQQNVAGVKKQLEQFLDFNTTRPNAAEIANNFDWFKNFSFLNFIRDVGKHITVNYMMAKDSVKKRLEGETGMSFTEFTYQLVQGYDFYYLYKHKNCKLQMGGSDQWGNIVTGTELIRRKAGGEAFAFTCPLITKADGSKFGKSEKGNVWLDSSRTSPYEFYQFWLNTSDEDAARYIKIFTFLSPEEVNEILVQHKGNEYQRKLQKKLAEEITAFVHGRDALAKAIQATDLLFSKETLQIIATLSHDELDATLTGVPAVEISREKITAESPDIVTFLAETAVFASKGEARKMVQGNGISLNKQKVSDVSAKIDLSSFIHNKYLFVQKGKTNYYLIKAV
ncbi:tyrosine--tRNA ligase [Segetibacter koreensis]|uniref:tyrosine--tRNA ligase n=1 Tax=Segetibacter koreensis TaxID=398037 RepID=UPI000369F42C|nr:tyrosine--tRNA ligase [Segetibacter koreensis]